MTHKYKHIPALRALKAFEASARHLSFTKASHELHVTQAAVSHQIKSLEQATGVPLFKRYNRALKLTTEGKIYLMSIRESLERIEQATRQLSNQNSSGTLNISVLPSFATKWLSRRIWRFQQEFADIDLRISAFESLVDFKKDDCDVAIRYSKNGRFPNLESELLLTEEVFPVCSRRLWKKLDRKLEPIDLLSMQLLHEDYATEDWHDWFNAAGISPESQLRGTRFSHTVTMLESVENNQGFALGRTPLVQDDIDRGVLVAPFETRLKSQMAYYLVYPADHQTNTKFAVIRDWLFKEAEHFKQNSLDKAGA